LNASASLAGNWREAVVHPFPAVADAFCILAVTAGDGCKFNTMQFGETASAGCKVFRTFLDSGMWLSGWISGQYVFILRDRGAGCTVRGAGISTANLCRHEESM